MARKKTTLISITSVVVFFTNLLSRVLLHPERRHKLHAVGIAHAEYAEVIALHCVKTGACRDCLILHLTPEQLE